MWKTPIGHQKAFNSAVDKHLAAIDKAAPTPNPSSNSLTTGASAASGNSIGNINPLTTAIGKPIGQAPQIKMTTKPKPLKGTIRHSLSKTVLK